MSKLEKQLAQYGFIRAKDSKVHEHIYGFCERNIAPIEDNQPKDMDLEQALL